MPIIMKEGKESDRHNFPIRRLGTEVACLVADHASGRHSVPVSKGALHKNVNNSASLKAMYLIAGGTARNSCRPRKSRPHTQVTLKGLHLSHRSQPTTIVEVTVERALWPPHLYPCPCLR